MKIKTKNILLGLGATTALVGASFAIVSCANDSKPDWTVVGPSKPLPPTVPPHPIDPTDHRPLPPDPIDPIDPVDRPLPIILDPVGPPIPTFPPIKPPTKIEATITFNQKAFEKSKNGMSIDEYVEKYSSAEISDKDKATLNSIFSSSVEGAIAKIDVENSHTHPNKNVIFKLTPAKGFNLNGEPKIYFVIDYTSGDEE